jgi:polyisoprenoid-binding protein YceI
MKGYQMKFRLFLSLLISSLGFSASWEVDGAHASARFKIRHMTVSNVSGEITGMTGEFKVDDKDANKMSLEGTLDMNTLNTNNGKRDEHLKSPDFFDAQKFPKATFKTKSITKGAGDKMTLLGELTMKGVTKPVTIDAELTPALKDPWGVMRRGLSGTTQINRKDFGISWNKVLDNGGLALGDTVDVTLEIELTQPVKNKKG